MDTTPQTYLAICEALKATGVFEAVLFGMYPEEIPTAESYPMATIRPTAFERLDAGDPIEPQRVERFAVEIRLKQEEGQGGLATYAKLNQLVTIAAQAVQNLAAEGTIPGLTMLRAGKYAEKYPTITATIEGEFSYLETAD